MIDDYPNKEEIRHRYSRFNENLEARLDELDDRVKEFSIIASNQGWIQGFVDAVQSVVLKPSYDRIKLLARDHSQLIIKYRAAKNACFILMLSNIITISIIMYQFLSWIFS